MKNGHTFCIISRMEKIASGFQFAGSGDSGRKIGTLNTLAYPSLEGHLQRS